MPNEPAADNRFRSSHASPAVDVNGLPVAQGVVYGVEYERHLFRAPRDRQVAYGVTLPPNLPVKGTGSLFGYPCVWGEFAGFGQVGEVVDAGIKQFFELLGR